MPQPGRNSDVEKVRREDQRWRKSEESSCRCAKRQESRETLCFSSVLWKGRLAKAAGAEVAAQRRDKKVHAVVARSTF